MNALKNCGCCGQRPVISIYFSLKDMEVQYHIECPRCHHTEIISDQEQDAIKKWNYLYPTLFVE